MTCTEKLGATKERKKETKSSAKENGRAKVLPGHTRTCLLLLKSRGVTLDVTEYADIGLNTYLVTFFYYQVVAERSKHYTLMRVLTRCSVHVRRGRRNVAVRAVQPERVSPQFSLTGSSASSQAKIFAFGTAQVLVELYCAATL